MMKRIIALVLVISLMLSVCCVRCFAKNTSAIPEKYSGMVSEALQKSEFGQDKIDTDSIFVIETTSPINLKKGIEAIWIWVGLPIVNTSDISYVGFDKGKYIQANTNFVTFEGMMSHTDKRFTKFIADNGLAEPSEITNLWITERVHLFAFNVVCDGKEYIIPYYFTSESTYNITNDNTVRISLGTAYTVDEFVALCEREAELYDAYRMEKRKSDTSSAIYKDEEGDVSEGDKKDKKDATNKQEITGTKDEEESVQKEKSNDNEKIPKKDESKNNDKSLEKDVSKNNDKSLEKDESNDNEKILKKDSQKETEDAEDKKTSNTSTDINLNDEQTSGQWVHIELQDTKEQIIEVILKYDMYYATYLKNTSENDISVEQIGENSEIIPKSQFSPTISGGTFPTDGAEKLRAGKYRFVIKSLGESNLSGTFSYMLSDSLDDFKYARYPDYNFIRQIDIYNNGVLIELQNKPVVIHNEVYLPLRELLEKTGLVNNNDSYINWDDGKIEIMAIEKVDDKDLAYHYGIEIDKAEYVLNPGMEEHYQQKFNISNKKEMNSAPLLIGDKTYVPYEYIDCMINKVIKTCKIAYSEK